MADILFDSNTLTDIANAIRSKTSKQNKMYPNEMANEIRNIGNVKDKDCLISLINKSITELEIPTGITTIGAYAFHNCKELRFLTLPDTLESIDTYAFSECNALTTIVLPKRLISIATYAFYHCNTLSSVTFKGTPTSLASYVFSNCPNLKTIKVPWADKTSGPSGSPWGASTSATIVYGYTEDE